MATLIIDNITKANIHRKIGTENIKIATTNEAIVEKQNVDISSTRWLLGIKLVLDYATMTVDLLV